ncbi:hypothetical protein [Methylosinus sp. LW3]|uniref:hypothetical protein n=1 Tax=Methylosinus sp. LW3 TaxID=107635 RepID=UPI0018DEB256|nr:hypothetical protein [Methylosinus sp. LW3]
MRAIESEAVRVNRQLDNVAGFLWDNTSLSGPNIDRVVNPLKYLVGTIGVLPATLAAASLATAGLGAYLAHVAQTQLAEFAEATDRIGVSVNELKGAQITFAKFGVDAAHSTEALKNGAEQFAQYRRNAGAVKDALEKFDEGFLKVADRAKSAGEFIDIISQKIRALPREEGLDLAKALFGDDTGQKLFEPIMRGQTEMAAFRDAAKEAGVAIQDGAAKHAQELRQAIEQAAEIANGKFLNAMQAMEDPIAQIKLGWYSIVGVLSDAIVKASELSAVFEKAASQLAGTIALMKSSLGMAHEAGGKPFEDVFGRYRHAKIGTEEEGPPMPPSALGSGAAGTSRKRYEGYDESSSGAGGKGGSRGAAEAAAAERARVQGEIEALRGGLEQKKALFEHEARMKQISEEEKTAFIRKAIDEEYEAERALLQKELDIEGQKPAQRQQILNKIQALETHHAATVQQTEFHAAEATQAKWESVFQQITQSVSSSLVGVIQGTQKLHDVLRAALQSIEQTVLNGVTKRAAEWAATQATSFESFLTGAATKSQAVGKEIADGLTKPTEGVANGLQGTMGQAFEGVKSMFSSVLDAMGGLLKSFLSSASSFIASIFRGLGGIGSSLGGALPSFDVGAWEVGKSANVDGKGGFPALVHPGEMVVPAGPAGQLRAALKGVGAGLGGLASMTLAAPAAVANAQPTILQMSAPETKVEAPPVTVHNYAPGLVIKPEVTKDYVHVVIREAIAGNNKRQSEAERRSP